MSLQNVLVFFHDHAKVRGLTGYLKLCGFAAFGAETVADGLQLMSMVQPKVIVLNPATKEAGILLADTSTSWENISLVAVVDSEIAAQKVREMGIEEVVIGDDPATIVDQVSVLLKDSNPSPQSGGARILVVDDESQIQEILTVLLTRRGYEVVAAGSGREALEILRHDSGIDLALMDLILPGMGGLQTLQDIRKLRPSLKVIMMSVLADTALVHRATELGVYDFIQKPIDPDELDQRIVACLASGEFRRLPWWKRFGPG